MYIGRWRYLPLSTGLAGQKMGMAGEVITQAFHLQPFKFSISIQRYTTRNQNKWEKRHARARR
jgi:hypothetical protein